MTTQRDSHRWVVLSLAVIAIACLFTFVIPAQARTINVPGDAPTIQEAIDRSFTGDEIIVAPGTYAENLLINQKQQLTIQAQNPGQVTIRAIADKPTITVSNSSQITLQGFVVTGGTAVDLKTLQPVPAGGGIVLSNSQKIVLDQLKLKDSIGLSLKITSSSATITQIVIPAPIAKQAGQEIDGIGISDNSDVTIKGFTVTSNPGNGIMVQNSKLSASQGQIQGNTGVGLQAKGATLTVADTTITQQQTGGVTLDGTQGQLSNVQIISNQGVGLAITGNSSVSADSTTISGHPQGAVLVTDSSFTLTNGTITQNAGSGIDAQNSKIDVESSKVFAQPGDGIKLSNSTAQVNGSQIQNNQGLGVNASGSMLTMNQSEVSGHPGDAVVLGANSQGTIIGSQIHDNGQRGLFIVQSSSMTMSNTTISKNGAEGVSLASGSIAQISGSTIEQNASYGILNDQSNATVSASTVAQNAQDGLSVLTNRWSR